MPVYEQILPPDAPQTTTTTTFGDQTEKAAQPYTHHSHQENEGNHYIDHPTQKISQPVDTDDIFEHSDPLGPDSYNTFFPKTHERNKLHLTLTLDGRDDVNSTSGDDGKRAAIAVGVGSASMTKSEEVEMFGGDKSYGVLTPAGLLDTQ